MCGIAGLFSVNKIDPRLVRSMTDALKHRGPDDEGFVAVNTSTKNYYPLVGKDSAIYGKMLEEHNDSVNLCLGHRRLSIIDISSFGHQPMSGKDGAFWITYNGEIYNYIELREELKQYGHVFATGTDTEVLLAAYSQWGDECVKKLNGMWAFVIYDKRKNILFASRDRTGVKPFYYWYDGKTFVFASEIKALLKLPFIKTKPNDETVWDYLIYNAIPNSKETFFSGVLSLEPAHSLILNCDNPCLDIKQYWSLQENSLTTKFCEKEFKQDVLKLQELLVDSIKLRLRSDVSVGSCLSGGLDSSTIVCIADRLFFGNNSELTKVKHKTFTAAYENKIIDERNFVEEVVKHTNIEPYYCFPDVNGLLQDIDNLIYTQDEPFVSTSIYAQYCVMRKAHESGIKVMLDGQGADELFAGYTDYRHIYLADLLMSGAYNDFINEVHCSTNSSKFSLVLNTCSYLAKRGVNKLPTSLKQFLYRYFKHQKIGCLNADFYHRNSRRIGQQTWLFGKNLNAKLSSDVTKYNLPILLKYEDRNSMAFSIESRVPFADDYRLLELAAAMPAAYKIHNGWSKYALRYAAQDYLPENICWRRDKIGFATPEKLWLYNIRDELKEILNFKDDYTNNDYLKNIAPKWLFPQDQEGISELWKIINLKLWLKKYF